MGTHVGQRLPNLRDLKSLSLKLYSGDDVKYP